MVGRQAALTLSLNESPCPVVHEEPVADTDIVQGLGLALTGESQYRHRILKQFLTILYRQVFFPETTLVAFWVSEST